MSLPALPSDAQNRFNPALGYKTAVFRPRRGLQSPELNEIQAYGAWEHKSFIDSTYGDGAMLHGGLVTYDPAIPAWSAASGVFYALGFTHALAAATFTVDSDDTFSWGVIVSIALIDENTDATLRDPCPGTKNYGQGGAARLQYLARWGRQTDALPADTFYHRLDFVNGVPLVTTNVDATPDGVNAAIARYDRNANGNYIVRGMVLSYLGDDVPNSAHQIQLSQGQANVYGYEQVLLSTYNFEVGFALDTAQVYAEPLTYTGDGNYTLRNTPIAGLGPQINGIKEITQSITHGNFTGASDQLPYSPVVSVSLVTQGNTTYIQGTDYAQVGDRIAWLNGGAQPSPGSTYTATWRYSTLFNPTINPGLATISVAGLALNTVFYVDYLYYIPRYDLVVVDQGLQITIVRGTPSPNPTPPRVTSGLVLGTIYVSFGAPPAITNSDQRRPLTSDLVTMQHAIDDLKYNVARLSLNDRLRSVDPVTLKKGIFVDPFVDNTYRDAGIAQTAEIASGILYLHVPWTSTVITDPSQHTYKTILPHQDQILAQNTAHSMTFQVNAFVGITAPPASVATWPQQLSWIDAYSTQQILASSKYVPYWAVGGVPPGIPWAGPPGDPRNQISNNVTSTVIGEDFINEPTPIPVTTVHYAGALFSAGETVQISFDNKPAGTVAADSHGAIAGQFATPAGTLSGNKRMSFTGTQSGAVGVSNFDATPFRATTYTYVNQIVYYDPLAETFTPPQDSFITDVQVFLDRDGSKGSTAGSFVDLLVTATEVGLPDRARTLTVARLYDSAIPAASPNATPATFTLAEPLAVKGNTLYSFILATPHPAYYAWGSELGQYDTTHSRWISAKPTTGTLLASSNSVTWLPQLKDDLTYTVNAARFVPSSTVTYPTVSVTNCTDLMLLTSVDVPPGTSVTFSAALTIGSATVRHALSPNAPISIPLYTGPVVITATLATTNPWITPAIDPQVALATATVVSPSTYVTRAIPVGAGASATASTLKVYLEIAEPDPNSVLVEYLAADGVTWTPFTRDPSNATALGLGVVDMPFLASATAMLGASATRLRITETSLDSTFLRRPYCRNNRMYFA